jgi:hypothetical protein
MRLIVQNPSVLKLMDTPKVNHLRRQIVIDNEGLIELKIGSKEPLSLRIFGAFERAHSSSSREASCRLSGKL